MYVNRWSWLVAWHQGCPGSSMHSPADRHTPNPAPTMACRHWFFGADLFVDGEKMPENLMDIVKSTLKANKGEFQRGWQRLLLALAHCLALEPHACISSNPVDALIPHPHPKTAGNSVIGFKDNSSAIRGGPVTPVLPKQPGGPTALEPQARDWDVLLTAETHNFPCAVAPYPGAETGAGGRIRDTHATGIGSIMGAATAGYCTGNLHVEGCAAWAWAGRAGGRWGGSPGLAFGQTSRVKGHSM